MAQVAAGEVGKLAVLFERHHRALFRFFVSMSRDRDLAEDMVQDVFMRMLRYRASYDPTQSFTAWMYQIARNAMIDQSAKRKGEVVPFEEYRHDAASAADSAEQKIVRREDIGLLKRAMDRLPAEKREVLVLARYQSLKYEEIAEILGCEVNTVKVRVYRAVRSLGQIFFELAGEKAS
jgi:RNA polymerase sigma-70 factor (ECF subfamily)